MEGFGARGDFAGTALEGGERGKEYEKRTLLQLFLSGGGNQRYFR